MVDEDVKQMAPWLKEEDTDIAPVDARELVREYDKARKENRTMKRLVWENKKQLEEIKHELDRWGTLHALSEKTLERVKKEEGRIDSIITAFRAQDKQQQTQSAVRDRELLSKVNAYTQLIDLDTSLETKPDMQIDQEAVLDTLQKVKVLKEQTKPETNKPVYAETQQQEQKEQKQEQEQEQTEGKKSKLPKKVRDKLDELQKGGQG